MFPTAVQSETALSGALLLDGSTAISDFIVREPVLDSKQAISGYQLTWRNSQTSDEAQCEALLFYLAHQFSAEQEALPGGARLYVDIKPSLLGSDLIEVLPAHNFVFALKLADLVEADTQRKMAKIRERGFGLMVRDASAIVHDKSLLPLMSHVEMRIASTDVATQAKMYGALKQSPVRLVASEIKSWKDYDACASLGLSALVGKLYTQSRQERKSRGVNPTQTLILQLMDMVRKNADPRQIETVLKRDVALSYKLLRYINSSGFGLGTEIQSLRHAVSLLGYAPLYRWLSVLLATASDNAQSQVLMQTAIMRGRFAEMLGHGLLPKSEAENLFVAGMFSLLDLLLGIPMEEVLASVQLPEAIMEALLSRSGMYGPFLALAEACESSDHDIEALANALFINSKQVNEAHLAALDWALSLKL